LSRDVGGAGERLEAEWQQPSASSIGEEAEVANAHEAARQQVEQEARRNSSIGSVSRRCLLAWAIQHLRSKRSIRRSRHSRAGGKSQGQIVDAISIRERPAEVEDRAIPGHWEGDLLAGSKNTHIATLVERHSRFVMLIKVPSKDTTTVVAALSKHVLKLPATLRRSLTWDRGHEMAKHKSFTVDTNVKVYCDPQSPWQRGTNENTNGLLRQYFPKKTDLSVYSQAHLNKVALRLNQRPRETLGFQTPASKLQTSVASTG
jgi:IS30 family transposase